MPDGMNWLMRPVVRNMMRIESLIDGSVDLLHVALCNDALDVQDENEARMHAALERK